MTTQRALAALDPSVPMKARRRVPRLAEVTQLVRPRVPAMSASQKLRRAATIADVRAIARRRVPRAVFDYVDGGAEAEISMARARGSFERVEFTPRVLRDVSSVSTSAEILGRPSAMPLVLAPTGFTRLMHHEGELAVARAARAMGIPYVLSTLGTTSPEDLRAACPADDQWFQLYLWRDRTKTEELVNRVRAAGYRTLVLTVDTPVAGARLRDVRNGLSIPPALDVKTIFDAARHPRWWLNLFTTEPLTFASLTGTDGTVANLVDRVFDPSITAHDIDWLREAWTGPLVVKGIQSVEDAKLAVAHGADGILISNHGGRQLDRAVAPLEALSEIRRAIESRVAVYVDGGILNGADIAAAVALGASACFVGRSYLYGLMAGGENGVEHVLEILRTDLRRTMQLLGVTALADLDESCVRLRPPDTGREQ